MASKILCGHPAQKKQFLQPFRQPKPRIEQIAHGKRGSPGKRVRKSAVRDSRFLIVVTIGKFAARLDVNSCHYADARLLQTLARLRRKKDQLHESWASGLGLLYSWLGIRCLRHSFRFYNFSRSMNFENFLRMPKNAKTTARLPFQHRNFGRENRRRHGLRMPADVRVLCFTAPAHTPLTTQLVFWEGEAFPEPPAFWFVLVCAGPSGKAKKKPGFS